MRRLYFAHPVTMYGTPQEALALEWLRLNLAKPPIWEVVNPNSPEHAEGYLQRGMQYFLELCATCDECAFMAFPNGKIGHGVALEVQSFLDRDRPVCELIDDPIGHQRDTIEGRVLSVEETRALIAEIRGAA